MAVTTALLAGCVLCICPPAIAQTSGARGSVIEGEVVDGDTGQGISGARVKLEFDQEGPWFTFADRAGHFRFAGLTAGRRYSLVAQQIGFMRPGDSPNSFGGGGSAEPGQREPVRIVLIRYAVIAGTVTDSNSAPVPVSEVTVLRKVPLDANLPGGTDRRLADGEHRLDQVAHLYTDLRGAYRVIRLLPGTYYVAAQPQTHGMPSDEEQRERGTYYGGALDFDGAKPIEAAGGRTIGNVDIQLFKQAGVRLSGRIVKPPSQDTFTSISLQPLAGESGSTRWRHATVDGDQFEFKDVLPGKYVLFLVTRERFGRPEAQRELAAAIQTVEVGQADLSGLTIAPQPPHDLPGVMRFAPGCRPGSVRISAGQ